MSKHASIHFKLKGRMYCVTLKTLVDDITLSVIEDRMYNKLALDERKDKLELSYIPMVVRCGQHLTIFDDEDLFVYLTSTDKEHTCVEAK
ncbi:hypothetical protein N665_0174s0001 [Sinapis alba]|nr:hypothetical protein N665_0174s0001 [Sinapis alba]